MNITLLVYGTLKRGHWNHDRFCSEKINIRPATIVGRLYALSAGFPAVVIPPESILAEGTTDPLADARMQTELAGRGVSIPDPKPGWDTVHGELITFADPARDLLPLDRLEGFRPDGRSLYRRSLVAAQIGTSVLPAWVYHMQQATGGQRLPSGQWPPGQPVDCGDGRL